MNNIAKLQEIVDNRHHHLDLAKFAVEMNGPNEIDMSVLESDTEQAYEAEMALATAEADGMEI